MKCSHETLSDETDEEGNRYCTSCGEWMVRPMTEVLERSAEMDRVLGEAYGKIQTEMLEPLMKRIRSIMRRGG